jgi:hypothetical protein
MTLNSGDGIVKLLDFDPFNKDNRQVVFPVNKNLIKQASVVDLHPEIKEFVEVTPLNENFLRLVISALGAYDAYGPNKNGDAFFEEDLLSPQADHDGVLMYKTYELFGKPFKFHKNSENDKSYGKVLLAVYNKDMKRVELVVDIDKNDAPDIVSALDNGVLPKTSMGFKAKYDVCLICGNKATKPSEYCQHAKREMLRIYPNGQIACVRNPEGHFFDISFVAEPAEPISIVLRKIASKTNLVKLSYERAIEEGVTHRAPAVLKNADDKNADIEKNVPAEIEAVSDLPEEEREFVRKGIPTLKASEKPLPEEIVNKLASMSFREMHATLTMMGITPSPKEFQTIVLRQAGQNKLAEFFDKHNIEIIPLASANVIYPDPRYVSESLVEKVAYNYYDVLENRSYYRPHLVKRAALLPEDMDFDREVFVQLPQFKSRRAQENMVALAPHQGQAFNAANPNPNSPELTQFYNTNPLRAMVLLSMLYGASRFVPGANSSKFDKIVRSKGLFPALLGLSALATYFGQKGVDEYYKQKEHRKYSSIINNIVDTFDKSIVARSLVSLPVVYTIAQSANRRRQRGEEPDFFSDNIARYPGMATLVYPLFGHGAIRNVGKAVKSLGDFFSDDKFFSKTSQNKLAERLDKLAVAFSNDPSSIEIYPPEILDAFIGYHAVKRFNLAKERHG